MKLSSKYKFFCRLIIHPSENELLERDFFYNGIDFPTRFGERSIQDWIAEAMQENWDICTDELKTHTNIEDGAVYECVFEATIHSSESWNDPYDCEDIIDIYSDTFKWMKIPQEIVDHVWPLGEEQKQKDIKTQTNNKEI